MTWAQGWPGWGGKDEMDRKGSTDENDADNLWGGQTERETTFLNAELHATCFRVCVGLLADGRGRSDHVERESEARNLAQGVSYDIV